MVKYLWGETITAATISFPLMLLVRQSETQNYELPLWKDGAEVAILPGYSTSIGLEVNERLESIACNFLCNIVLN
jgi:hypothetical protein